MKTRAAALLPKREVLRRTRLAPATLAALVRARAFPAPVQNGRWDPQAVDHWNADMRRRDRLDQAGADHGAAVAALTPHSRKGLACR